MDAIERQVIFFLILPRTAYRSKFLLRKKNGYASIPAIS